MSKEPNRNVYIGHRYVPKIMGEWDNQNDYEGLSIVTYQGTSYTSKKRVPVGIDILNEEFWVVTGNYNAQVEEYRQDVRRLETEVDTKAAQTYVDTELNKKANQTYVNTELGKKADTALMYSELDKKMTMTTEEVNIFVEKNGDDSNSGLMASKPVLTLEKAISLIPDTIGKDYTFRINIGVGHWGEILNIKNKTVQGILEVKGTTENADNHRIYSLRFDKLTGHVRVLNLFGITQTTAAFIFTRCSPHAYADNIKALGDPNGDNTSSGNHGVLADYGTNLEVRNSTFSNKRYGMRSNYLSRIFSVNNSGVGNHFGMGARWGGILQTYGSIPEGVTPYSTDSGGLIIDGKGHYEGTPRDDVYLTSTETSIHDGPITKRVYNIVNVNASNVKINIDEKIVLNFHYPSFGPVQFDIKYGGTKADNFPQFINAIWTGGLSSFIRAGTLSVLHSTAMTDDKITVAHNGNNNLKVTIIPDNAVAGNWGIEMTSKIFRNYSSAPILQSVEIEKI